jgi:hypothetical protein
LLSLRPTKEVFFTVAGDVEHAASAKGSMTTNTFLKYIQQRVVLVP